jgi:hypothetical protein
MDISHLIIGDTFYRLSGNHNLRYYKCKIIDENEDYVYYIDLGRSKNKLKKTFKYHSDFFNIYPSYEKMLLAASKIKFKKLKKQLKIEIKRLKENKPYLFI